MLVTAAAAAAAAAAAGVMAIAWQRRDDRISAGADRPTVGCWSRRSVDVVVVL